MRIAVIVPDQRPNPLYRALWPMDELSRRGHTVGAAIVERQEQLPPFEAFLGFDVLYIWRMAHPPLRRLAEALQSRGVAVIWDNDDDITTVPKGSANYRQVGGIRGQRSWAETQAMIKQVDAVTTPSEVLAERFRRVGQEHVHVIENYVPAVAKARKPGRRVVVGWVAAGEHSTDVKPLGIRTALTQLLERRPEVEVETVGIALDIDSARYNRTTIVPLFELPHLIARFDIGIAPLTDTAFNRARSNVKVKEYAAGGAAWLASPVTPYAALGELQGGRHVADGTWLDAMSALVDDARARKQLAARAQRWAETQTIHANVGRWEEMLGNAVERARSRTMARARG